MLNVTSINLRRGNLVIFNGHADNNELAHRIHDMSGITPRGGDLFPMICFQGREKITSLLRYLHRNRPTTDTGVIHLERSEYLSSVSVGEEERGIILCGESKLETTDRRPANPFIRTTLQGTAPLAEGTWVYNTTGRTQVSLQRSSSGNRLYLGQHANFFENRNRLLNKQFRNILQSLQGAAPLKTHHYQIDFDFNHVTPKIGEVDIINFFYSLQSPENYEHFHKQFVNPETQNIDYDKLNLLFINPKEYHKKYTPEEIFVPVDERACIWINFSKKQNQSESQMNTNNFAERMSHRTIERSELATRAERQKLPSSTTRKDKLKRSHSFS